MGVAAILFRDLRHSHALWSLHALVAALPILGIFVVNASAVFEGRRLAIISLAIYGVAFAMPAFRLGGDMAFGVEAFYFSFLGIDLFGEWARDGHFWYPIACTIGILANISFILGYISCLGNGILLTRWLATIGSCLSLFVIFPLVLSTELNGIYLGYGLWVTGLLALALGSWRIAIPRPLLLDRLPSEPDKKARRSPRQSMPWWAGRLSILVALPICVALVVFVVGVWLRPIIQFIRWLR